MPKCEAKSSDRSHSALTILCDGIVEASHLQQQFTIGVVGIGIVGNQHRILLECLFGVGVVSCLPVRVPKHVVCGRVVRRDFCALLEMFNGGGEILLAELNRSRRRIGHVRRPG